MTEKNEQSIICLVFGRKGTGKTTLINKMIKKIKNKKRILIIDLLDKFGNVADVTFSIDDSPEKILEYFKNNKNKNEIIRFDSINNDHIEIVLYFAYMIGNFTIFMDEADRIFGNRMSRKMQEIIIRGRNQGIDLILSTLRVFGLHIDVRNQADLIYCFGVVNKMSLKSLIEEFGANSELIETIRNLKNHDYIKYDVRTGQSLIYCKYATSESTVKNKKKRSKKHG